MYHIDTEVKSSKENVVQETKKAKQTLISVTHIRRRTLDGYGKQETWTSNLLNTED